MSADRTRPPPANGPPNTRRVTALVVALDQGEQAVVLGAAGGAHPQMQADAREPGRGVLPAELGLDVAVEQGAGDAAAGVAVVDLEDRLEEGTIAR